MTIIRCHNGIKWIYRFIINSQIDVDMINKQVSFVITKGPLARDVAWSFPR